MELLFLTAHLPSPQARQAGQRTSYHICRSLAGKHAVHLLSFATETELELFHGEGTEIFRSWDVVPVNRWTRFYGVISSPVLPVSVAVRNSALFRIKLRKILQTHIFDGVILDHIAMWQYRDLVESIPVIVGSAHDVLSQLWQRKAENASSLLTPLLRWEEKRLRNWEGSMMGRLSLVSAHNEKDAGLLRALDSRVPQCPIRPWCSVEVRTAELKDLLPREEKSIVFWGAMDRRENVDAAEYAVREILPRVQEVYADIKFFIAGSHSETLANLSRQNSSVHLAGFVPDIASFLGRMQIALLPLRLGAGIKVKILECMAAGSAVVTTSVGIEGIGGVDGQHYLLGETAESLAGHVTRLLSSPGELQAISAAGCKFVRSGQQFSSSMEQMDAYLTDIHKYKTEIPNVS